MTNKKGFKVIARYKWNVKILNAVRKLPAILSITIKY